MKQQMSLIFLILPFLVACEPGDDQQDRSASSTQEVSSSADEIAKLHILFEDYNEEFLELSPLNATFRGDYRYNDRLENTLTDEYYDKTRRFSSNYLDRINAMNPDLLQGQNLLSYQIFKRDRLQEIEAFENGLTRATNLLPVSQFFSTPNFFASLGSGKSLQPFRNTKDYDDWLKRLQGFYDWMDSAIINMRTGVQEGIVRPRIVMEKVLPQLQAHIVDDPTTSVYYTPINNFPDEINDEDRTRLTEAYKTAIVEHIVPAYQRLHDFIRDEYLAATRESVGLSALPHGRVWYEYLARNQTTTNLTPEVIHQIGLNEVERITGDMHEVMQQVSFKGSLQEFFEFLRTDDQFYYADPAQLMQGYEDLRGKINPQLEKIFDVKPQHDYVLKEVEPFRAPSAAAAFYQRGTVDGSRPGAFYVNTYEMKARPIYSMTALSLHEASPGHHFQLTIQQELEGLPAFRRFGGETAFAEGWGLYSEDLGEDMGLYDDPYQRFGKLAFEIWRANRLVVDTGMHYKGWTREQAIEFMLGNSPITETDAIAEVERYIVIPGQALAYKIGQLKLLELREHAREILGDAFDIREFHNQVLLDGAIPLDVLEKKINDWLASKSNQG
ncbi:MAG: DUF885 domain-containing protein [Gammaproteobacteria bacterium]